MRRPMATTHRPDCRYAVTVESDQPFDITRNAPVM